LRAKGRKHGCATQEHLERTAHAFKKMVRSDAVIEQRRHCIFCRDPMTFATATAEHMLPRSKGGATDRKNIKASCEPCNFAKGNGTDAWMRRVLHGAEIPTDDPAMTAAYIRHRLNRKVERSEKRIRVFVGMPA
jgi:hypothetical protein